MTRSELLTVTECGRADELATKAGVPSLELMERAGTAVAHAATKLAGTRRIIIACGPGNNGGDGYVAARVIDDWGRDVTVAALGDPGKLSGDAAHNYKRWCERGKVLPLSSELIDDSCVVIDALFGAGLSRPLDAGAAAFIDAIKERGLDIIAVDVPSGVDGDSGSVLGTAAQARTTVTFFRRKPGHLLYPGRTLAGRIVVADIGIPATVLEDIRPQTHVNNAHDWFSDLPVPGPAEHKYSRGHAVIVGGGDMTGAARLAAMAARRMGAGLVTIAAPAQSVPIYAAGAPGALITTADDAAAFSQFLEDPRRNAVLIGPGAGVNETTRDNVLAARAAGRATVLDADALGVFVDNPCALFDVIDETCVLTPHDGEFHRLFPDIAGDRLSRARAAALRTGAVVLLKGADTVIAAPDGRAIINAAGSPHLATAGSGDVLAGMILGLVAEGVAPFTAAQAAAWLHGRAADTVGRGCIAEDLPAVLPALLQALDARLYAIDGECPNAASLEITGTARQVP